MSNDKFKYYGGVAIYLATHTPDNPIAREIKTLKEKEKGDSN